MNISRTKLGVLLVLVALVLGAAAVLLWLNFWRASLEVADLHPGDSVSVRSGISFIVPEQASGTGSRWRSKDAELNNPLGLSDAVVLNLPTAQGEMFVGIDVYWVEEEGSGPVSMLEGATRLAAASSDGAVQVRWLDPGHPFPNVAVITRLPDRLPGCVVISGSAACDAAAAWHVASDTWRLLGITGVELPPPPN